MTMSSRRGAGWVGSELPVVSQQGPEAVDESAGERWGGLAVDESFAAFAVVELSGWPVTADAGQRGQVEHAAQSAVVAFGSPQVAGDTAGIFWYGHQSGVGRQASWGGKRCQASAGDDEEFGAQTRPETGKGLDDSGVGMVAEAFGGGLVDVFDFVV